MRRLVGSGRPELRPVLEQLLAGPTPDELAAGYQRPPSRRACKCSAIEGEGTGTVTVDLSSPFGTAGRPLVRAARAGAAGAHGRPRAGPGGVRRPAARRPARHGARRRVPSTARRPSPTSRTSRRRSSCSGRCPATRGSARSASPAPPTPSRPRACSASPRRADVLPARRPHDRHASSGTGTRGTFDVSVPVPRPAPGEHRLPRVVVRVGQGRLPAGRRAHPAALPVAPSPPAGAVRAAAAICCW